MTITEKHDRANVLREQLADLNKLSNKLLAATQVEFSVGGVGYEAIRIAPSFAEGSNAPTLATDLHPVPTFPELAKQFKERMLQELRITIDDAQGEYAALFSAD